LQVLAPPALTFIAATAEAGAARRPAGRSWQRSRGDAAAAALAPAWAAGAAGAPIARSGAACTPSNQPTA